MRTRILTQEEVTRLLDMPSCIECMEEVLRLQARGGTHNPLRWIMRVEGASGLLGMMPGALLQPSTIGLKAVAVEPTNHRRGLDSHQGVVMLFDPTTGVPAAILEASSITALRTAAVSAVATRALARPEARSLAILGTGVQARAHLAAMCAVRDLEEVRVFSPDAGARKAFAETESTKNGVRVSAAASVADAVAGADIVCTATSSNEPVLLGTHLEQGMHINAVGACTPNARELDTAAVLRSRMIVDCRESADNESGDYLIPLGEGALDASHIAGELGGVLNDDVEGRRDAGEITLFKSLGIAIEDLAAASLVLDRAREVSVGVEVDLEGRRDR